MATTFRYTCYRKSYTSIPQIIQQLQDLQKELQETDLAPLLAFNQTYLIITKNVFAQQKAGYFSDARTMQAFDINFASYYFDALKKYVDGEETTPAWQVFFDFCQQNAPSPSVSLALGANAHVNNDLGLALFDSVGDNDFKQDFDRVNSIIYKSMPEIVSYLGKHAIYQPFMRYLIKRWRYDAWNNYQMLQTEECTKEDIEHAAYKKAQKLAKINLLRSVYHAQALFF